jgi:hypothetical protein
MASSLVTSKYVVGGLLVAVVGVGIATSTMKSNMLLKGDVNGDIPPPPPPSSSMDDDDIDETPPASSSTGNGQNIPSSTDGNQTQGSKPATTIKCCASTYQGNPTGRYYCTNPNANCFTNDKVIGTFGSAAVCATAAKTACVLAQ